MKQRTLRVIGAKGILALIHAWSAIEEKEYQTSSPKDRLSSRTGRNQHQLSWLNIDRHWQKVLGIAVKKLWRKTFWKKHCVLIGTSVNHLVTGYETFNIKRMFLKNELLLSEWKKRLQDCVLREKGIRTENTPEALFFFGQQVWEEIKCHRNKDRTVQHFPLAKADPSFSQIR